jgi:hypothetical protein
MRRLRNDGYGRQRVVTVGGWQPCSPGLDCPPSRRSPQIALGGCAGRRRSARTSRLCRPNRPGGPARVPATRFEPMQGPLRIGVQAGIGKSTSCRTNSRGPHEHGAASAAQGWTSTRRIAPPSRRLTAAGYAGTSRPACLGYRADLFVSVHADRADGRIARVETRPSLAAEPGSRESPRPM